MGILSNLFKQAFKEQTGIVEERDIEEVAKAANNIFVTEGEEKKLFSKEADKVQGLIHLTRKLISEYGKAYSATSIPSDLRGLYGLFSYLRSHTIDKLHSLTRIHRAAVVIVAEAKQSEKYDKMLNMITRIRNVKYRRILLNKRLAELNAIRLAMRDIDKKAEDIEAAINILKINTQNMLNILKGKHSDDPAFGRINLPEFLRKIEGFYPIRPMVALIFGIREIIKSLILILEAQLDAIPLFYDNIHKIEIRDRRIERLIKQTKLKAA